ncbi:MAG TPA: adenylyl-sulfate kinase [Chthoniobacteraceae bacterium]|nr:adenylyl-sulfate kinase [Chthoniobacteraceae bacterium]
MSVSTETLPIPATAAPSQPEPVATRDLPPFPANTQRLKIVFVGHVDHGKSTLIGRIFHDTHSLPDGKVDQIRKACAEEGMEFEYAFLLDALLEEQAQNITIDTTQIQFRTAKRPYVIIDAPGHKEFLKNMISGAASADAAVLLIAASEGVREQSRRHGYLLSLLGIRQVVVAVNKMDLVDYSQETFEKLKAEYTEFLGQIGLEARLFIPISARNGVNIATRDTARLGWYDGPSITEALDRFEPPKTVEERPLRFPIQDIYRFDARRILAGRIESGTLRKGDKLVFSPNNKTAVIASIERWNSDENSDEARAGESIGITLTEQIFVERGYVASHETETPIETNRFKARLFWMGHRPLEKNRRYKLKITTQEVDAELLSIERVIDASTLGAIDGRDFIARDDVAEVTFRTRSALVLDNHDANPILGRFVIMDGHHVAGGGIIFGGIYTDRTKIKSSNIYWSEGIVTADHREIRNGHKSAIVWLTGLSGSGKSTIAHELERELFNRSMQTYVLDGDNIRHGLNANLAFSPEDRMENIRRVAEVARLMADSGHIVITSFIAPYKADRRRAREIALEGGRDFYVIHIDASLEACEARDPKQLYKKARAGEISHFTGIDAPYEIPEDPDLVVNTENQTVSESVAAILEFLRPRVRIEGPEPELFDI